MTLSKAFVVALVASLLTLAADWSPTFEVVGW